MLFSIAPACASLLVLTGGVAPAEPVNSILRLAPANSFVVVGVDDFSRMSTALEDSDLGRMWNAPEMQTFVSSVMEEMAGDEGYGTLQKWLQDADIEIKELPRPTGMVGMALFFDSESLDIENQMDEPRIDVLIAGDFGDGAEKLEEAMIRGFEDLDDKDEIVLDFEDYRDVTVHVIKVPEEEVPEDEFIFQEPGAFPFGDKSTLYIARSGGMVLVTSRMETMERSIDGVMGDRIDSVGDTELMQASLRQLDDAYHAHAHLLLNDELRGVIGEGMGAAAGFMVGGGLDFDKLLSTLGLKGCRSLNISMTLDTPDGVYEQEIGILMESREGLFALMGEPVGPFTPPAFIGADVTSMGEFSFDFSGLLPLARKVIADFPEQMRGQAQMGLQQTEQMIAPVLDNLGPNICIVSSFARPFDETSARTLYAIQMKDALPIANTLSAFGPQIGLTPRDFQGNQIFEADPMMGGPGSFGLGAGWLFIGQATDIENAMRLASDAGSPTLAKQQDFTRATGGLIGNGVGYAFTSLSRSLEYQYWMLDNLDSFMGGPNMPTGADVSSLLKLAESDKVPGKDFWLRFLGDSVFEVKATDTGFHGRSITKRPVIAN